MATNTNWINDSPEALILFGPFRVLPKQRLLMQGDKSVHLGSRAFDVLIALLERPGELVSKEDLMAKVWPNTFVGPANLAMHISAVRRALGDGRDGNRYVVNIPGRGYRFVGHTGKRSTHRDDAGLCGAARARMPVHPCRPRRSQDEPHACSRARDDRYATGRCLACQPGLSRGSVTQ
jgi:DNA-binding winged helix-turn-helix (wHTH) protein